MSKKGKFFSLIETAYPLLFLVPAAPYIGGLLFVTKFSELLFSFDSLLGLTIVSIFYVAGFNSFNAVFDNKIDLINKAFRGIPSKKITKKETLIFSITCFGVSIILSALINLTFFVLMIANIFLAIFYSLPPIRLKEKYIISNITIALGFGFFPALLGWSVFGEISNLNWPFLISVLILYTSISFLKDFDDSFGDGTYNVKTLPSVLGPQSARKWIIVSITLAYVFILVLTFLNIFKPSTYILVLFLFWVMYINTVLINTERGIADNVAWHMTLLGAISVLSLAIINIIT